MPSPSPQAHSHIWAWSGEASRWIGNQWMQVGLGKVDLAGRQASHTKQSTPRSTAPTSCFGRADDDHLIR